MCFLCLDVPFKMLYFSHLMANNRSNIKSYINTRSITAASLTGSALYAMPRIYDAFYGFFSAFCNFYLGFKYFLHSDSSHYGHCIEDAEEIAAKFTMYIVLLELAGIVKLDQWLQQRQQPIPVNRPVVLPVINHHVGHEEKAHRHPFFRKATAKHNRLTQKIHDHNNKHYAHHRMKK